MPTKRHGGDLDAILATAVADRKRMNSNALGAFSLTLLGVASVVGAGIFVVTGDAAAHYAGPAVLISFVLAGIVAGLTALCYAELAASIPVAGSTYSYALAAFGSFVGWFIGMTGIQSVHFDEALAEGGLISDYKVVSWFEDAR